MLKDVSFFEEFLRIGSLLCGERGVKWAFVSFSQ